MEAFSSEVVPPFGGTCPALATRPAGTRTVRQSGAIPHSHVAPFRAPSVHFPVHAEPTENHTFGGTRVISRPVKSTRHIQRIGRVVQEFVSLIVPIETADGLLTIWHVQEERL
ncbi:hypothetical protein WA026_002947 [Henosepilachna vigintioctopunctata]|uniref:Uncharacterized protein n=1 Tax=Henosepilachna vigintioctopunctata TaxID=420089 RepID=A0AAW1TLW4_9CUCU